MAVKIRLKRFGKIRAPYYRIVVADSRKKRDGRVIEEIGKYHPTEDPSVIEVVSDRAQYWLGVGAQPTEQVLALLKLTGDWGTFNGDKNATNTVKVKESLVPFVAEEKKKPVIKPKAKAKTEAKETESAAPKAESDAKDEPAAKADAVPKAEPGVNDEPAAKETPVPKDKAAKAESAAKTEPAAKAETKPAAQPDSDPSEAPATEESTDTSSADAGESKSTDGD